MVKIKVFSSFYNHKITQIFTKKIMIEISFPLAKAMKHIAIDVIQFEEPVLVK